MALVMTLGVVTSGCEELLSTLGPTESQQYVYWITASEDTYASCGRTAACEEGDLNFGRHGFLAVAAGPLGYKRSYIDFALPDFPEGTIVDYAKLEMYHPGQNEDGAGDNITLSAGAIFGSDWSESTLTWNMRPDVGASAPSGNIPIYLRPQDWSGSSNISNAMQQAIDDVMNFQGFVVNVGPSFFSQQIEKGFYSTNYTLRTRDDMDRAPRLLLKVTVPAGSGLAGSFLPTGFVNGPGGAPVNYRFVSGTEFPATWEVTPF